MDHPAPDVCHGAPRVRLNQAGSTAQRRPRFAAPAFFLAVWLAVFLAACGGGGGEASPQPLPPNLPGALASAATLVAPGCTGGRSSGTVYLDAEVEPTLAVSPLNPQHLVAAWQQDRASDGGVRALVSAVSFDGGQTWARSLQPFSRCGGALAGSAGDHERATDPWVDIALDGTVYLMGLAFSGANFTASSRSAMLVSRSTDGGRTFSAPLLLHGDGAQGFNDKNTITADPTDARFIYAVWDRLDPAGNGPALLARSSDGGQTWEAARQIVTPRSAGISQTIGNRIVVLTSGAERGVLVNVFTQIDTVNGSSSTTVRATRSLDKGLTWSVPVVVGEHRAAGTRDAATGQAIRDGGIIPAVAAAADGRIWVAWQDARFTSGAHDAIALVVSSDGARTFSTPVAANRDLSVPAFTPNLATRPDGGVALLHYDLRSNTAAAQTLLADAWLVQTSDAVLFSETALVRSFDMAQAPDAGGLFLGDYQGLGWAAGRFIALAALASGGSTNRTDIFALGIGP